MFDNDGQNGELPIYVNADNGIPRCLRCAVVLPFFRLRRPRPRLLFMVFFFCAVYAVASQRNIDTLRRSLVLPLKIVNPPSPLPPPAPAPPPPPPLPPLPFDEGMVGITHWEETLPQNTVTVSDIQGEERYLRYLNENWGVGFNNQLQEIIVHAHLAYLSNRSYVVPPLNFAGDNDWYPLSAFIRGTLVGSPAVSFPPPPSNPAVDPVLSPHPPPRPLRAVSRAHFVQACPEWQGAPEANYTDIARAVNPSYIHARHADVDFDAGHGEDGDADANDGDAKGGEAPRRPTYLTLSFAPLVEALGLERHPPADVIMRGWAQVLRPGGGARIDETLPSEERKTQAEAPGDATCVTVHAASEHVFDYRLFGSLRILTLLPALLESPVLRDLHWSALVHAAVQRNLRAWGWVIGGVVPLDEGEVNREERGEGDTHTPLEGMLALHLRRGDYEKHCVLLREWGAGFLGVNEAEGMGDRYVLPPGGANTPDQQATFARHCWPTLDDVIRHVRRVREEWEYDVARGMHGMVAKQRQGVEDMVKGGGRGGGEDKKWRLKRVYVSTNGDSVWWERVTGALSADGWEVRGSADMDFVGERAREEAPAGGGEARRASERVVGLAVDMEVAARAEVFIGNGWSSFTSNVNLFRMAHGAPRASMRFW